jgi:hypothetical protein
VGVGSACPGGPDTWGLAEAVQAQETLNAQGGALTPASTEAAAKAALAAAARGGGSNKWLNFGHR